MIEKKKLEPKKHKNSLTEDTSTSSFARKKLGEKDKNVKKQFSTRVLEIENSFLNDLFTEKKKIGDWIHGETIWERFRLRQNCVTKKLTPP